jgi:Ner family transcriptional regulator
MHQAQRDQHEWIKSRLRLAGSSLAKIARELELSPATVTIVSQGMRRSQRIETAISTKLGVPAALLWPEKYGGIRCEDRPPL